MTDEPRYTLDEAARLLARQECLTDGHDLQQTVTRTVAQTHGIVLIRCYRCAAQFTETGGPWTEPPRDD